MMEFSAAFEDTCFPCSEMALFPSLYYDATVDPADTAIEHDAMTIDPFEYNPLSSSSLLSRIAPP
jgi:hypothetical protein